MERDFMGLIVKQEIHDEAIDAVPLRSSPMQWSFSNKASSAVPQEQKKPNTGFNSLASAGLVTITTKEAFDSNHKSYSGVMQNNIVSRKQNGVDYTMTTYPTQHVDRHAIHRHVTSQTNLTGLPTVGSSFGGGAGQNLIGSVPMEDSVSAMHSSSPIVGTTDLRNTSKISGAPSQLTIFYNGSVCVYNDISPEKAQDIMLLAGNVPPMNSTRAVPAALVQASPPRHSVLDGFVVSRPYSNSISVSQSTGWPGTMNHMIASKQGGILVSPNKVEPLKVINSSGSMPATYLQSGTVPQFRRKSLARFLEKRKERVINPSPYADKNSPECSTPGAGSASLSMNSSGSCPVPAIN